MDIRLLQPSDAVAYWDLRLFALKESPVSFGSTWEESVNRPNPLEQVKERLQPSEQMFTMGAWDNDQLVGVVTIVRETQTKFSHRANLYAMYVAPSARGKGLAKRLIQKAIDHATQFIGLEQINLIVVSTNEAARRLYESVGFVAFGYEGKSMKYGEEYWDEILMKLIIT